MPKRRYYRRPAKAQSNRKRRVSGKADYLKPRIDPGLRPVFRKIGVPEPGPFTPDQFQLEALELIKEYDVLVSAPTGAGKTWIASQTIRSYLAEDLRVWYASPLKALSNSIYQEFCREFGAQYCGILTGDRKENPKAPIVIGTTEILRNQLYDAMHRGTSVRTDLVILDEAHYLSDPDRGVVWEEVLIYLPPRVQLLLLSATISNADEVCEWLMKIRGTPNRVVLAEDRPVPLEMLFLFPDGLVVPLGGNRGLNSRVKKFLASNGEKRRRRYEKVDFGKIIICLREFDLLPAIFFLKSKRDCDRAILACPPVDRPPEAKRRLAKAVKAFLKDYPHLEGHRQIRPLLERMVASHHGGQLPYWKVLIEKMMNRGYLDAIFSTSTVAAGVNFPARTVALMQSDRFNGHEFADLTATELHQMIGRAGRRGKDYIGFALVIPGAYQDPRLIYELKDSPPEPILSQININFPMTLNLLLSHTPLEVKDIVERSFAEFQERGSELSFKIRWNQMLSDLKKALPKGKCDIADPYEVMENIEKRSEIRKEIKRLTKADRNGRSVDVFSRYLEPGRLFLHKNGNVYVAFQTYADQGRLICKAHNIKQTVRSRKHRPKLRKIDLSQIESIFNYEIDLPTDYSPEKLDHLFDAIAPKDLVTLDMDNVLKEATDEQDGVSEIAEVEERLRSMSCETCEHLKLCHGKARSTLRKLIRDLRALADQMGRTGGGLWLNFKRHLRFLKETGFVDETDRLTPDGYWASKLRLDQPLLIAEAIRKGALDGVSPEILAGGLAPFVWDGIQEVDLRVKGHFDLAELESMFNRVLDHIEKIMTLKNRRGFDNPAIMFWPAAALFMWAKGVPWKELLEFVSADEGNMASLIMRTADHIRQVINLKETHPRLASVAEGAIELILREPVYVD